MRKPTILLLFLTTSLFAVCPLGFPADEACIEDSPSCALFTDGNGDGLCDNPEPPEETPPPDIVETGEETPIGDTDSLPEETVEVDVLPDSTYTETGIDQDDAVQPAENEQDLTSFPPSESEDLPSEGVSEPLDQSGTVPEPDYEAGISEEVPDSSSISEEIQVDVADDSAMVDTVTVEEIQVPVSSCPLGFTPAESCPEDDPSCTFYLDADQDLFCDNPGERTDSTAVVNVGIGTTPSGCPLDLTPETACPSPDNPLCPSYRGWDGCTNPSGGGIRRTLIVLIATAVLLIVATILKRCCRGRRKGDRRKRKIAHITVQTISLIVLGFVVQGCFCPLGITQYILLPGGIFFLGGLGIAVLLLPLLYSAFFDRIYCGWVCPFGALQDLLGKLHVPRPPRFSHKVHSILIGLKFLIAVLFFSFIALISSGQFEGIRPMAFFCKFDPFHTIFSFFLVGSFIGAVSAMSLFVFFPRFFCKYICFYGAILSFLGRIGLWKRITRKHPGAPSERHTREE